MVASKATQKLSSIASSWPIDPFRPNIQLKNFLNSLSAHPRLTSEAVQAAQLLRDNAMQKKYALSAKTLQPASMPRHYERLVEGYERSARGAGRPWWQVFFGLFSCDPRFVEYSLEAQKSASPSSDVLGSTRVGLSRLRLI